VEDIAAVPVDPDLARVYVEGWQSWSPAGLFPVGAPPPPVTSPDSLVIDCQDRRSPPAGVFQGSGLLAVDPGGGAAPVVFGAVDGGGWGIDYFKIDFCCAGAYQGVGEYREGLRLIRSAIGPDAVLLGCGAPTIASAGLVDAMRIGPDIAACYEPRSELLSAPSQRNATRNVLGRAWQHGRLWINDPDCMMLRPSVERREDWASVLARYGGVRASGDGLDQLDSWGLGTTRALLRPSPADVFTPA